MPYYFYTWTPEIVDHLIEHGILPEEFEEIVSQPSFRGSSRSTGNPLAIGLTTSGKFLCCIFKIIEADTIEPITAYEIGD
jgi:hypothetical protein